MGVVCQFSPSEGRPTLKDFIPVPDIYPAGRLDTDSEGLLLLTNDGQFQKKITHPKHKWPKTYWVQVEGTPDDAALKALAEGIRLNDGMTLPAQVTRMNPPENLWERTPPIRVRAAIPTSWISITLQEGRNRQVRRMTAAVGHPTLRLIRWAVGSYNLEGLTTGTWRDAKIKPVFDGAGSTDF
jgi:23S rRNA pseudouridine2457 synthase